MAVVGCSLYAECVNGATLEWNTVNDTLVKLHTNITGVITGSPSDDLIFVVEAASSQSVLLKPGGKSLTVSYLNTLLMFSADFWKNLVSSQRA